MAHPRVVAAACLVFAVPALARTQEFATDGSTRIIWQRVFASPLDDWVNHVVPTRDGHFVVAGFLNRDDQASDWRALLAKLTPDGRVVWQREHGAGTGVDAWWAVDEGTDGRFTTAGFTTRTGAGGIDALVGVHSSDGVLLREGSFGGSGYDRATDLAPADSGYVLAGFTERPAPHKRDVLLVKVDASGNEQWRRTYGGPENDVALYIERTADGGYVLSGTTGVDGDVDVLLMKVDRDGNEAWKRVVGAPGGNDIPHNVNVHRDGRIQVTGYTQSWGATVHDMLAITYSPTGEVLRHEVFGGPDDDRVMLSAIDDQGRNWMTGYTKSAGAGGWDVFVTRLDAYGAFEGGVTTIGGPADDNGTAILPLPDGSLLVAAYSGNLGHGRQDAVVMRLAAPQWREPAARFTRRRIR